MCVWGRIGLEMLSPVQLPLLAEGQACSSLASSITGVQGHSSQVRDEQEVPFWLGKGREDIALLAHGTTFFRNLGVFRGILAPATSNLSRTLYRLHPQLRTSASLLGPLLKAG